MRAIYEKGFKDIESIICGEDIGEDKLELCIYGSAVNGLFDAREVNGCLESDLDLTIIIKKTKLSQIEILRLVSKLLKETKNPNI